MTPQMWTIAGLGALGWLVWRVFECWFYPFTSCRRCKGEGRFMSPLRGAWRRCPRCKGSGTRVRLGRRVYDKVLAVKKDAVG